MSESEDVDEGESVYRGMAFWDDCLPIDSVKQCEHFNFRADDILVCTYPRCGTTLTQEIVWEIVNHQIIEKDVKYESLHLRFPFMELKLAPHYMRDDRPNGLDVLSNWTKDTPRLIKTHLPYFFLGPQLEKVNPKIIVVIRNPKDCVVALYHFYRSTRSLSWNITWEQFLIRFMKGKTIYGDFFDDNLGWWAERRRPNFHIVRYEDLIHNKHQEVRSIANFLGYTLTPEKIDTIVHNTAFDTMKKNENVNIVYENSERGTPHLRKGIRGDWRTMFTVAQSDAMDEHTARKLEESDLTFIY